MPALCYHTASLRILAADDDDVLREVLLALLLLDGHRATIVADGLEALDRFPTGQWDLVLTDRDMPGLDGEKLAVALKVLRPEMPVVMVTGSAAAARYAGVDAIVAKPFTQAALALAITRCLARVPCDSWPVERIGR